MGDFLRNTKSPRSREDVHTTVVPFNHVRRVYWVNPHGVVIWMYRAFRVMVFQDFPPSSLRVTYVHNE